MLHLSARAPAYITATDPQGKVHAYGENSVHILNSKAKRDQFYDILLIVHNGKGQWSDMEILRREITT